MPVEKFHFKSKIISEKMYTYDMCIHNLALLPTLV